MAFKDSASDIVISDKGELLHKSFNRLTGTIQSTETKIVASDAASNDQFGFSVAVGSGRIVVGASRDDSLAGSNSGSAYIFDLDGTQIAKIVASDADGGDFFGFSVAVGSGRIVVGAYKAGGGHAYIFDLDGTQIAIIEGTGLQTGDQFGAGVAVGSGRIVVGADADDGLAGSAYIFDLDGTQLTRIKASDAAAGDLFGRSVAVGSGRIVVGAYRDDDNGSNSGSAYIFDLDGTQLTKITASDGAADDSFGFSVAVGSGRIVVGAYDDDDNGSNSGSAYIFDLDGTQLAKIKASDGAADDEFGRSVAVGSGRIVVGGHPPYGATGSGSAYIFDLDGTQLAKIVSSDAANADHFGVSLAIGSGRIVVGADFDDDTATDSGSAYIYDLDENFDTYIERQLGY